MTGFAAPEALVAAWQEGGYRAAREQLLPWLPLILFEAQDKVSLAVRKEILRRRGVIVEAGVWMPGVVMPVALVLVGAVLHRAASIEEDSGPTRARQSRQGCR